MQMRMKRMMVEWAFGANMALLMFSPLLMIFFGNFKELYYYLNRHPTRQTQAVILEARIGYVSYSPRWGRTRTYFLKYRYSVGGKTYVFTGVNFAGPGKRPFMEEVLNYQVGKRYPIYYLGKFPHRAALHNYWSG